MDDSVDTWYPSFIHMTWNGAVYVIYHDKCSLLQGVNCTNPGYVSEYSWVAIEFIPYTVKKMFIGHANKHLLVS